VGLGSLGRDLHSTRRGSGAVRDINHISKTNGPETLDRQKCNQVGALQERAHQPQTLPRDSERKPFALKPRNGCTPQSAGATIERSICEPVRCSVR